PGGLAGVLETLGKAGVNVEYMYAFPIPRAGRAVLVFRLDRPDEAVAVLQKNEINVVGPVELFRRHKAKGD
ncbi:MAG: amino acid-binding protein, partial [Verrucomicrobia bacterium]|nr:amino acid-binding protein [Verrucomicrobiota bacterium]